jgi:hypothetical protein
MFSIPDKAKQFLVLAIKILIVGGAFYFIYSQLTENDKLDWGKFKIIFRTKATFWNVFLILFLSFLNRFLEILKWQNLVATIKPIPISEASKQVLGALTAGIFTPNGFGEYAGKALFFEKVKTKKIVFLNLICNGIQLILSVVFGTIGLLFLGYPFWVMGIVGISFFFFGICFFSKKIKLKGYSLEKLIDKLNEVPKLIHRKNILLAIGRYLTFSHQYYFLFLIFGIDLPYFTVMATIMTVYFLASSLPSFQFLDFAVKGSVGVYFFGLLHVNEWIVVFITTLMWFLNVVIPVVFGSYFVLKFKPKWKS